MSQSSCAPIPGVGRHVPVRCGCRAGSRRSMRSRNTRTVSRWGPPIEIDASELSGEIEGMTARNYTPISERAAPPGQFPIACSRV